MWKKNQVGPNQYVVSSYLSYCDKSKGNLSILKFIYDDLRNEELLNFFLFSSNMRWFEARFFYKPVYYQPLIFLLKYHGNIRQLFLTPALRRFIRRIMEFVKLSVGSKTLLVGSNILLEKYWCINHEFTWPC